jgi:type IV secretion system protein VirB10
MKRLLEGAVIDAVLTNRLDGSFSGPLNALVTSPVYTQDRANILIPAGARVLGTVSPVQAFGESRLAVKFHRLLMPDRSSYTLDKFAGLNERGDAGLKDQVDRHYLQLFGASIAIGTLSGLAQYSTRSGASGAYSFSDAYGQSVGGSLAASGGRILDRFLNVLPTVTIREGHRLKIYLTSDLDLPPWHEQ